MRPNHRATLSPYPGDRLSSPRFDRLSGFETASGYKVKVKTTGTSDAMLTLMNQGGLDLVSASGNASSRLIRGKRVAPITVSLIARYKSLAPRLQKAPWHDAGNSPYGLP